MPHRWLKGYIGPWPDSGYLTLVPDTTVKYSVKIRIKESSEWTLETFTQSAIDSGVR